MSPPNFCSTGRTISMQSCGFLTSVAHAIVTSVERARRCGRLVAGRRRDCMPVRLVPRARVRFAIDLQQLRRIDVRITLRGAQARVPEQFLDDAEIGAALQQMRRE